MKIYDITQPLFESVVFPGDPAPKLEVLESIPDGSVCNTTAFSMCSHNGTHVDAPFHFCQDGLRLNQLPLDTWIGPVFVADHVGDVTREDARNMLEKAAAACPDGARRILIKGKSVVTEAAAEVFAQAKLSLLGNESQTVGPEDSPMRVHHILLGAGLSLLEGVRLAGVKEGVYFLYAAPINLGAVEGSPCRAVLTELN